VILDCQVVTRVTAAGLSALLELGRSAEGLQTLALTRLSRPLTLAAVQAGLAERFAIYATTEACLQALSRDEPAA
jgi:anti-anti-sigma regulatory factor